MSRHKTEPVFGSDPAADFFNDPPVSGGETSLEPGDRGSGTPGDSGDGTPAPRRPKYEQLDRLEALLRPGQIEDLERLAREVSRRRAKGRRSERITKNTMVRIAVAVLLAHGDRLTGDTEHELEQAAFRVVRRPPKARAQS